jgi:sphingosine kinase
LNEKGGWSEVSLYIMNVSSIILKDDNFYHLNDGQKMCLELERYQLVLRSTLIQYIHLVDVSGVDVIKASSPNDKKSILVINLYPKEDDMKLNRQYQVNSNDTQVPIANSMKKRVNITIKLGFNSLTTADLNFEHLTKWKDEINKCIANNHRSEPINGKNYLIFLNPHSGSGRATQIYNNNVLKVFDQADIYNKLVITTGPNDARNYIKNAKDLHSYRGILVLSGDGLIYEIINGLMERDDWEESIKIPFGQIPCGSANGLTASCFYLGGENYRDSSLDKLAETAAFLLARRSIVTPIDLIRIELENDEKIVHSFLNIEWAIVADVDYESEQYRYLGAMRFLVGAIKRILGLRVYKGRISFLPIDNFMNNYKPKSETLKVIKASDYNQNNNRKPSEISKSSLLNPLSQPVPNDWFIIEDKFVFFLIINLPLMGSDFFISPTSRFDNGTLDLLMIREGATRLDLLKIFLNAHNGEMLNNPVIEHLKVKAFRLEPLDDTKDNVGQIMVDGERVNYGAIQGEILNKIANTLLPLI